MAEKIFLKCSAKEKTFANGGSLLNIGVKVADLLEFAERHATPTGYLNLCVRARREAGKFGDTHTVTLDTWTPKPKGDTGDSTEFPF